MVKNLTIESITDGEGKLSLENIDTGLPTTHVRIHLLIDRSSNPEMAAEELAGWARFVDRTEGRIDDASFHRQPHGVYEPVPSFDEVE